MNRAINRVFYTLKPLIPRSVQIALRRRIARDKLKKYSHVWPIDPSSTKPPEGWPGWPEGKRFALVLSHDVDTKIGQDRVLDLAALELQLGFRSAFNFVPERYANNHEVKAWLKANGFEINVHGLKHDGKLFGSRRIFEQQAVIINQFLQEWGVSGFTAPSMLCRPDWLHDLDITHSLSTFDTDPFEPQPDPVGTIFPFAVFRNPAGPAFQLPGCAASSPSGLPASQPPGFFIELPYTLPQDHLLFVILREKNIDTWKRKLDWIASHGGMALLNTHSDYMAFNGAQPLNEEYPIRFYIEFLEYVRSAHAGEYFHATPSNIAAYVRETYCNHISATLAN